MVSSERKQVVKFVLVLLYIPTLRKVQEALFVDTKDSAPAYVLLLNDVGKVRTISRPL